MDKFFWPVIGVLFAAALGLWAFGTRSVQAETESALNEIQTRENTLKRLASVPDQVVGPASTAVAREHKEKLAQVRKAVLRIMRERDFDVGRLRFDPPRPGDRDMALFRVWLTGQYAKRTALLSEANVRFPAAPAERGEVSNWEDVGPDDMNRLVEELAMGAIIGRALAGAGAEIVYTVEDPTLNKVTTSTRRHGIDELVQLSFGDTGPRTPRRRRPALEEERTQSFEEKQVRIVFLSHLKVVPDVVRRLEAGSEDGPVFVVKSVASMRISDAMDTGFGQRREQAEDKEYLIENPDREKPMRTTVRIAYLSFPAAREAAK